MSAYIKEMILPNDFDTRLEDMHVLLDLEAKCLSNSRLTVREVITLQTLREFYPGSSDRIRRELLMLEGDHEELLLFVVSKEDHLEPLPDKASEPTLFDCENGDAPEVPGNEV